VIDLLREKNIASWWQISRRTDDEKYIAMLLNINELWTRPYPLCSHNLVMCNKLDIHINLIIIIIIIIIIISNYIKLLLTNYPTFFCGSCAL
jgi:hypothetical protein